MTVVLAPSYPVPHTLSSQAVTDWMTAWELWLLWCWQVDAHTMKNHDAVRPDHLHSSNQLRLIAWWWIQQNLSLFLSETSNVSK